MRHAIRLALIVLAAAVIHGQDASPRALLDAYVAAFNDGDVTMAKFFEAHGASNMPLDARMERYRQMRSDLGSLTVRTVRTTSADAIVADIAGSRGELATFTLQLAGNPPQVRGIRVLLGGGTGDEPSAGPALPPRDAATAFRDIEALVTRAASDGTFSGVATVGRSGVATWQVAVGMADAEARVPNDVSTKFNIGSIGKSFTTVAVAQLVAAGTLKPTDTVGRFLPDYPNATVRDSVTVQMLLDMRSGIGDIFGPAYDAMPKARLRTLRDYLPLFADAPLLFAPGQGQQYSNGGFVVLGLIVQQASGMDYYDYVQRNIFDRAGMRDSGFFLQSADVPKRAKGYTTRTGGGRVVNADSLPERASAAGGVYSTAPDLLRYDAALVNGTLVAEQAMLAIGRRLGGMGIAGGAPGLNAALDQDVNGYTVIVLANLDPPAAGDLARAIRPIVGAIR